MKIIQVNAHTFYRTLRSAKMQSSLIETMVHLYEVNEYAAMDCYLSVDRQSGFVIKGGNEVVNVFSVIKGRGKELMNVAIRLGGTTLDCFDGYLVQFYSSLGFKEFKRVTNWTPGEADVVYLELDNVV